MPQQYTQRSSVPSPDGQTKRLRLYVLDLPPMAPTKVSHDLVVGLDFLDIAPLCKIPCHTLLEAIAIVGFLQDLISFLSAFECYRAQLLAQPYAALLSVL